MSDAVEGNGARVALAESLAAELDPGVLVATDRVSIRPALRGHVAVRMENMEGACRDDG
jgi:hypothetical protein